MFGTALYRAILRGKKETADLKTNVAFIEECIEDLKKKIIGCNIDKCDNVKDIIKSSEITVKELKDNIKTRKVFNNILRLYTT